MTNRVTPYVQLFSIDGTVGSSTNIAIKVGELGNATYDETGGTAEDLWTLASHGLTVGSRVQFSAVGTGATGYTVAPTDYYVVAVFGANEFQLSATKGGSPVEGTDDSAGVWTVVRMAEDFYVQQTGAGAYHIARLIFEIIDDGIEATKFGALTALTNGVVVNWQDSSDSLYATFTPDSIKQTSDFGKYAFDLTVSSFSPGASATDVMLSRFTLSRFLPGELVLESGDKLALNVNDDLTGITSFTVTAEGWIDDYV